MLTVCQLEAERRRLPTRRLGANPPALHRLRHSVFRAGVDYRRPRQIVDQTFVPGSADHSRASGTGADQPVNIMSSVKPAEEPR